MKIPSVPFPATLALCAASLLCIVPRGHAATTGAAPEEAVALRVTPEREFVYRRGPREIILELELKAKRPDQSHHTPVNVSVVLDRSGSMEGPKIEKARQAACAALDQLDADDIFSLVIFDQEVELLLAPERVGSREHRDDLKARINRIQPRGSTALYAGVKMGAQQVRRFLDKERVNRVILVSDGLANVGPSRTSDLAELGHSLGGEGLSVTTIGLGEDFNEDLMTGLAEASHAHYYYVKDAEKLPSILTDELGAASARVAGNVRIRITVPAGVRLREMIGHPEIACQERSAEIALPEVSGAEQRLFHLRCTVDETNASTLPLADVSLSYEDALSKKEQTRNCLAEVRLTDDARQSDESVRNEVAQNVNVLQNRLDKEAAVRLADSGRAKEAAQLLRQRAAANLAVPSAQQMPDFAAENLKLDGLADELTRNGNLQNTSRKAAQWDNYQDKYQRKPSH